VQAYQERAGASRGRRRVETVDLLRAAVVLLHAAMEDVLRSALEWRWPETTIRELLDDVPMLGHNRGRRIGLSDLMQHRDSTVDDLIRASVAAHLERASFNNVGDVKRAVRRIGLDPAIVTPYEDALASSIARRHSIVHRADRQDAAGSGHSATASLPRRDVVRWIDVVEAFCADLVARL
jgi:hypothetical protein